MKRLIIFVFILMPIITIGQTDIFKAIADSNFVEVKKLIEKKDFNANVVDSFGNTALILLAEQNQLELVKLVIDIGADVNQGNHEKRSALYQAVRKNNVEVIKYLIEKGANINSATTTGFTPLITSSSRGYFELTKYLIDCGANINAQQVDGYSALHFAAQEGNYDVAKLLIERGAQIDILDKWNYTPLCRAAQNNNVEIIDLLLQANANIENKSNIGYTPLAIACTKGFFEAADLLIKKGANIEAQDQYLSTPLIQASEEGHVNIVELLIKHGAQLEHKDYWGATALHRAVSKGNVAVMNYLIEHGSNIETRNMHGLTPLQTAVMISDTIMVELLISKGANINTIDSYNETPLNEALNKHNFSIANILIKAGADIDRALASAGMQIGANPEIAMFLIEKGADVNTRDVNGATPLMWAVFLCNPVMMEYLINHGAKYINDGEIFIQHRNEQHRTQKMAIYSMISAAAYRGRLDILHRIVEEYDVSLQVPMSKSEPLDTCISAVIQYAIRYGYYDIVDYFMQQEDLLNYRDTNGYHLLHYTAGLHSTTCPYTAKKLIIEKGVDINVQAQNGYTPLICAALHNKIDMVKLFVHLGADMNLEDTLGNTVLDIARIYGHQDVVSFLKRPVLSSLDFYALEYYDIVKDSVSQRNISMNIKDKEGYTLLHQCILRNDTTMINLIISKGLNLNCTDSLGRSPLHYAVFIGNTMVAETLINGGADVNTVDLKGETALLVARKHNYGKLVFTLLYAGAKDVCIEDDIQIVHPSLLYKSQLLLSKDEEILFTEQDLKLCYLNMSDGKTIKCIEFFSGINALDVSNDNNSILISDSWGDLRVLEFSSGEVVRRIYNAHLGPIASACFSKDGRYIVSGGIDNFVKIWDVLSGKLILKIHSDNFSYKASTMTGYCSGIESVAFDNDDQYIAFSGNDNLIRLHEISSGKEIVVFQGHTEPVVSFCFTNDNSIIISGSKDKTINIWSIDNGTLLKTLNGHTSPVSKVWYIEETNTLISISKDEIIEWDFSTGNILNKTKKDSDILSSVILPSQNLIITSHFRQLKYWRLHGLIQYNSINNKTLISDQIVALGDKIIQGIDNSIREFDLSTLKTRFLYKHSKGYGDYDGRIYQLELLKDQEILLSASSDKTIKQWDLKNDTVVMDFVAHAGIIKYTDISFDESLLLTSSMHFENNDDNVIKIWDLANGKLLNSISNNNIPVRGVVFSPDSQYIVASFSDSTVNIYDINSKNLICSFKTNQHNQGLFYLSDYDLLCTSIGKTHCLINFKDSITITRNVDKFGSINCWDLSNDKAKLIYGRTSGYVILYDLLSNEKVYEVHAHDNWIVDIVFSTDEKYFYTVSGDITTKVWRTSNGEYIAQIIYFPDNNWVVINPDFYYAASRPALSELAFRKGDLNIYPFEQFDLKYNRPDIVLSRIGYADSSLIEAYHKAYLKRLKKMGFTEDQLSGEFHIPETEIKNFEYMPVIEEKDIDLYLNFKDDKYKLDRYNIWINEVPLYGMAGKSLRNLNTAEYSINEKVELMQGENKIQVSCLNEKGAESYKETVYVTYQPQVPAITKKYLIAISVSDYKDARHNLKYAVKDGRDMARLFAGKNAIVDTLFNQNATRENIIALKQKLMQTHVDDEVILYISGHGLLDKNYDFYFATYDINFEDPAEKGILYDDLEGLLDGIPARKKLLLMDACHSGEVDKDEVEVKDAVADLGDGKKGDIKTYGYKGTIIEAEGSGLGLQNSFELMQELFANLSRGSGAIVISAAAGTGYALESAEWNNGVFTYCILNGLKNLAADANGDKSVTVTELKNYVSTEVERLTNGAQKPTSRRESLEFDWGVW